MTDSLQGSNENGFTLYVSKGAVPTTQPDDWHAYFFDTGTDFSDLPGEPDFLKLSISDDGYFVTSTESPGGGARNPVVYALNRTALLSGDPTADDAGSYLRLLPDRIGPLGNSTGNEYNGFQTLTPVDVDGPASPAGTGAFFLRQVDTEADGVTATDGQGDYLELFEADADFVTDTFVFRQGSPIQIPIAEFDFLRPQPSSNFDHVLQPGGGFLDGNTQVVSYRAQYRNFGTHESIVGNFTVDLDASSSVGRAGIRWFELRRDTPASAWQLHQEGTLDGGGDDLNRWIGAIAQNAEGDIAIGYNVASATKSPSLRYTGRRESDPLGQMTVAEVEIATGTGFHHSNRWGDYNTMVVDPVGDETFVFTGSYIDAGVGNPGGWKTRIAAFTFAGENEAPRVENVIVSGSNSAHEPYDFAALFEAEGAGGNQLLPVEVGGANTITLQFSEPVDVEQGDLRFRGLRQATDLTGSVVDFDYDPLSFTATWEFGTAQLPADQYLITLADSVTDLDSPANALDGEWANPLNLLAANIAGRSLSANSGDAVPGGDFQFVMTILPGDFDSDLDVDLNDFVVFGELWSLPGATYDEGDLDGDGFALEDLNDFVIFNESFGLDYSSNLLILADLDGDGVVEWASNGDDAALLVANYGMASPEGSDGDLDGDGDVDPDDLALMAAFEGLSLTELTS